MLKIRDSSTSCACNSPFPDESALFSRADTARARRYNFNHERWALTIQASRFARVCLEEAFKYAMKRKTFGKTLLEHPVIRAKIAEMARQVECTHAQLENITYQMCTMSKKDAMEKLGGATALLKAQSTKTFEFCAREAAQIFGGASYVRGGQGEKVERLYREVRAYAIPGGSEEIMCVMHSPVCVCCRVLTDSDVRLLQTGWIWLCARP